VEVSAEAQKLSVLVMKGEWPAAYETVAIFREVDGSEARGSLPDRRYGRMDGLLDERFLTDGGVCGGQDDVPGAADRAGQRFVVCWTT
jgi:hypothetical protein